MSSGRLGRRAPKTESVAGGRKISGKHIEIIDAEQELARVVADLVKNHGYAAVAREVKNHAKRGSEKRSDLSLCLIWALVDLLKSDPAINTAVAACQFLSRAGGVSVFYLRTPRRLGHSRMVRKHQQIHSLYHRANRMVKADPDFRRMAEFHRGLVRKQALSDGSTLTAWIKRRARADWDQTNEDP